LKTNMFIKKFSINAPVDEVFKWHARPGVIERLSPPWDPLEVVSKSDGIKIGANVVMKIKTGLLPFKIKWIAEHVDYQKNNMFKDIQKKGPFSSWTHTHNFYVEGKGSCLLEDEIQYAIPLSPITSSLGSFLINKKLERIFHYRHITTALDIKDHMKQQGNKPLIFLISGASGLLGSSLVLFLTTGGHRVYRLVRRHPVAGKDEIFWDPESGILRQEDIPEVDAVIHLAGENIGEGSWSVIKKKRIVESRTMGTILIADTLARLEKPPKVFICASAIGYYGNRGDELMTEESASGSDFISSVCRLWEKSTIAVKKKGIRTVLHRIGIVISPLGGALKKILPAFRIGAGAVIGSGTQYMSWIDIDDVIGSIYHSVYDNRIEGPVNVVAPAPVTNKEFSQILAGVLNRPILFNIPEFLINIIFGEMGREILLSSTRVAPIRLSDTGYRFRFPDLESSLRHLLGRC